MAIELDRNVRRFLALSDLKAVPHVVAPPQVSKWQPRHTDTKKAHRGGKGSRAKRDAKRAEKLQAQQAKVQAGRNALALQAAETERAMVAKQPIQVLQAVAVMRISEIEQHQVTEETTRRHMIQKRKHVVVF